MQLYRRNLVRGRRQIVGEGGRENSAILVIDDFLEQRVADALRDAAVHLAIGDHRIDDAAGVLRYYELFDLHVPGLHVDFDDRNVAGIGEGARRIVVAGFRKSRLDLTLEAMRLRIGLACKPCDRDRAVRTGDFRRFHRRAQYRRAQPRADDLRS